MANGCPAKFIAQMINNSAFGQIIGSRSDHKEIKLSSTGNPANNMDWQKMGTCEEDAPTFESKDPAGNKTILYMYWNEEKKTLNVNWSVPKDNTKHYQVRHIDQDGKLVINHDMIKPSGSKHSYYVILKKIK